MKVYLSKINESWIIDRVRDEWYEHCDDISSSKIKSADIVWIIAPWVLKNINKKNLKNKKVICSYYHFDFNNFSKTEFEILDKYVDEYHVISKKTEKDLKKLTNKKITSIPFWINQEKFFNIEDKENLRNLFGIKDDHYLVGSFQRDTEGSDLVSPKLIKGPDIFIEVVKSLYLKNNKTKVVLAGTRRQYVINALEDLNIPYIYYEMVSFDILNKLYNLLDLYVVSSRIEGGPQAVLECAVSKTPIISTDVGVASEILSEKSIFSHHNLSQLEISKVKPDINFAFEKSMKYTLPNGVNLFKNMLSNLYES